MPIGVPMPNPGLLPARIILVCPNCKEKNRLTLHEAIAGAACTKCGTVIKAGPGGKPLPVDEPPFKEIEDSPQDENENPADES